MGISREERRRRIMERGSDRLALITGQLQNIDPSSPLASPAFHHRAFSESFMPQMVPDDHLIQETVNLKYQFKETSTKTTEEPKLASTVHQTHQNTQKTFESSKPEISRRKGHQRRRFNVFSSKKLNSSIVNSEGTRSLCSLIIASLVVLSYVDYPLLGLNIISSDSILTLRPVYVLLFTDFAIVVAHLFTEASGDAEVEEEKSEDNNVSRRFSGGGENWEGAEKLLERGLVVYQAFRGIFIDCSVYMVVVICGLSFL